MDPATAAAKFYDPAGRGARGGNRCRSPRRHKPSSAPPSPTLTPTTRHWPESLLDDDEGMASGSVSQASVEAGDSGSSGCSARMSSRAPWRCRSPARRRSRTRRTSAPAVGAGPAATPAPTSPLPVVPRSAPRHDGTVRSRPTRPGPGPWLVKVSTGEGRLTTWYAHMQAIDVSDGDQVVAPGQQLGEVGSRGNSTGCHLHFEVHPRGGSIYEDGVDPTEWLQTHAGRRTRRCGPLSASGSSSTPRARLRRARSCWRRSTSSVTRTPSPAVTTPTWASGAARMRGAIALLDRYGVEVVGLQELQRSQKEALVQLAGDRYAIYSPPGDTDNSIAWRRDRWAFVSADTIPIPYFRGNIRDMPVVRLRSLASGQDAIFVNVHNPANVRGNAARFRAEAMRRELATMRITRLPVRRPGVPHRRLQRADQGVLRLTAGGTLTSPAGGSHAGRCAPPRYNGIDWIFGTNRPPGRATRSSRRRSRPRPVTTHS